MRKTAIEGGPDFRGEDAVQGFSVFVRSSNTAVVSLQHSSLWESNLISCSSAIHRPH